MSAKHTPGPWHVDTHNNVMTDGGLVAFPGIAAGFDQKANSCLIAAAPELLAACINARDILATDRQAFVDCNQLRDGRTDDPIAHGLVWVADDTWLTPDDAEVVRDYDRAIEMIDMAASKATGAQQ